MGKVKPKKIYYLTGGALMLLLALTAVAAFLDLGPWNAVIALTIAVCKALLILFYFMHLRFSERLQGLVIATAFVWLSILFVLSQSDYLTRGLLHIAGK